MTIGSSTVTPDQMVNVKHSAEHSDSPGYYFEEKIIEYTEYIYIFFIFVGLIFIIYAIKLHFDIYDASIIPIKATITDIQCNRHIISRKRDTYHCKINIRYVIDDRILDNVLYTEGTVIHYVGDDLVVYVDRENPVNVYTPYMSDNHKTLIFSTFGLLIIFATISARFLHIN